MMKNFLLIIATCLFALGAQSQEMKQDEHMKFMGISMGLPIKKFHEQLLEKGLKRTQKSDFCWFYSGMFAGSSAEINVYYDNKLKMLKHVLVKIQCFEEKVANDTYSRYKGMIEEKYINDIGVQQWNLLNDIYADEIKKGEFKPLNWIKVMNKDGVEKTGYYIPRPTADNPLNILGIIIVNVEKSWNAILLEYDYSVNIAYSDEKNNAFIDERNNADL